MLAVMETALGALADPLKIEAGLAEGWALLLVFKLPSTVSSWLVCVTIAAVAALRVGVLLATCLGLPSRIAGGAYCPF